MFRSPNIIAMSPCTEAREQDNERREKQQNHGGQQGPDGDAKLRMAPAVVFAAIDVILDDAEEREIRGEDDDGQNPRERGDEGGEEGAADARAEGEQEGDECEATDDGVEDHYAG